MVRNMMADSLAAVKWRGNMQDHISAYQHGPIAKTGLTTKEAFYEQLNHVFTAAAAAADSLDVDSLRNLQAAMNTTAGNPPNSAFLVFAHVWQLLTLHCTAQQGNRVDWSQADCLFRCPTAGAS